jgi:phosphoglucosamine mutase
MKKTFFGTDGIRAESNSSVLNGRTMMKLGMALGKYFTDGNHRHKAVIGKDTRLSGYMIEQAVTSGLLSMGMDVFLFGPIPTPGVAMLTKSMRADLGIMITASHNKFTDNGLKIFDKNGNKLSDEIELEIERLMTMRLEEELIEPEKIGRAKRLDDANGRYLEFLKNTFPSNQRLEGLKIVVDCANGASYISAPIVFWELGAEVIQIGVKPDGLNINKECGSTDTRLLSEKVKENNADIGLALDGDGDRLMVCDENGQIIDGDQILGLLALELKEKKMLTNNEVVGTLMTNVGLENKLRENSIDLVRAPVGDRYVKEEMLKKDLNLGGEQSGHIILKDYTSSGDGIIVALQILSILKEKDVKASKGLNIFQPVPQKLMNFKVNSQDVLDKEDTKKFLSDCNNQIQEQGRIIARMSGTEPYLRVMIECNEQNKLNELSDSINHHFSKL